ncbi:MAG: transketolase [Planctomycetota bacterium]|nr:transketolase [Planctomycetota bacterium]
MDQGLESRKIVLLYFLPGTAATEDRALHRIAISKQDQLTDQDHKSLSDLRRSCAGDIARMVNLAGCGHPGGSLSTLDFLLIVYSSANVDAKNPRNETRDRVIVSHGHISPGVYSVLGHYQFFDRKEALMQFRLAGSAYSGHVETGVKGVEWNTGNLGQGLSAGCASAYASKLSGGSFKSIVLMGDGEQQKGQISEARRFGTKFNLSNLIAYIDLNGLQIGGDTNKIMPQAISEEYRTAGWNVLEVDGHDLGALYSAFRKAYVNETEQPDKPTVIVAKTIMGKGISFMEGDAHFHGVAPNDEQVATALKELGQENDLAALKAERKTLGHLLKRDFDEFEARMLPVDTGTPRTYEVDGGNVDCRTGYGNALADLGEANNKKGRDGARVVGISCDLEGSVKMQGFHKNSPDYYIETGIQEHHAATLAGRLSWEGYVTFLSTFGVFAVAEGYNQQRLNDINHTNIKLVATHCGMDVGEDGPTHQSIDWIALMSSPFGFKVFSPADANQCDRMTRATAALHGNVFMAMGRSKVPVVTTEDGKPFFGGDYVFEPGKADWIREGTDAVLACFGPTVVPALEAQKQLTAAGKSVAVVNFGSLKPIDRDAIRKAAGIGAIVSVEDHAVHCGLGSLIAQVLGEEGLACKTTRLGVSRYGASGKVPALFEEQGMSPEAIAKAVSDLLA